MERTRGLLRYAKVTGPLDVWKAPIAAGLLVLMPFPPNFGRTQPAYVVIIHTTQLVFLAFLPQLLLGLREVFRSEQWRKRVPLVIYSGGFLLLIGAVSAGIIRYRETVFTVIFVIIAAGIRAPQRLLLSFSIYAGLASMAMTS